MKQNIKQIATIEYAREGEYETIDIEIGGFEWNDTFGVYVEKSDYRGALFLADVMNVHLINIGEYLFVEIPIESVIEIRFKKIGGE